MAAAAICVYVCVQEWGGDKHQALEMGLLSLW